MLRNICCALVVAPFLSVFVGAAPIITAGNHDLLPDTAGQVIPILVSGVPGAPPPLGGTGDGFQGLDLALTVHDNLAGPLITDVDVVGPGTVFFGNNLGQWSFPNVSLPARSIFSMTMTETGYVGPNGTLAFLTVDTTGVVPGEYDLHLHHEFRGIFIDYASLPPFPKRPATLIAGTLNVLSAGEAALVPEPSTIVLLGFGVIGLLFAARGRRKG